MPTAIRSLLILVLFIAGCATRSSPTSPPPQVNLSGYSETFKQGYADGCTSARTSHRRDDQRYRRDSDYMMGWNDGHSICAKRK